MKILALDSTALTASVAVCENERLLSEFTVNNGNTHSETILPMIASMLERLGIDYFDVFFIHNINVPWFKMCIFILL